MRAVAGPAHPAPPQMPHAKQPGSPASGLFFLCLRSPSRPLVAEASVELSRRLQEYDGRPLECVVACMRAAADRAHMTR